jgi:glyoxylase-like metal-dependent hydrolase (beta-lactamase superfamily II)
MKEISPGVWHWTAVHPKLGIEVSSYYVVDGGTLIDPMLPPEGVESFRRRGDPQRIVLTNRHHYRQSDAFRSEFGCPVLCHEAGLHEFEAGPQVDGFRFSDQVAPGIEALEVGAICPEETALHIDREDGLLSFADGLINHGGLGFVPDALLGDDPDAVKSGLRDSLRTLLDRDFDGLLFAHGDPLLPGGKRALKQFLGGTR